MRDIKLADKKSREKILKELNSPCLTDNIQKKQKYIITLKEANYLLSEVTDYQLRLVETGQANIIRLSDLKELICQVKNDRWTLVWNKMKFKDS